MPDSLHQSNVIVPDTSHEGIVGPVLSADTMKLVKSEKPIVGVEENLAAYNAGTDNMLSTSVFVMIVVALLALSASWGFILRQSRNFFYRENEHTTNVPDTNKEIRSQIVLVAFATFVFSVIASSISFSSIFCVSGLMSTKTSDAPLSTKAFAVETNV